VADDDGAVADDSDFASWLHAILSTDDAASEVPPAAEALLRDLFEREGPVPAASANTALLLHELGLAERALATVVSDLHRTNGLRPELSVDVPPDLQAVVLSYEWLRGVHARSLHRGWGEEAKLVAEIADAVQENVSEDAGLWPVCPIHGYRLHAEVDETGPVWQCRFGKHRTASIGSLGAEPPTPEQTAVFAGLTDFGEPVDVAEQVLLAISDHDADPDSEEWMLYFDAWRALGNLVIVGPPPVALAVTAYVLDRAFSRKTLTKIGIWLIEPLLDDHIAALLDPLERMAQRYAFRVAVGATFYHGPPEYRSLRDAWREPQLAGPDLPKH